MDEFDSLLCICVTSLSGTTFYIMYRTARTYTYKSGTTFAVRTTAIMPRP